tara:strand:+ start:115 stop:540 length:426 start_codon:yes stop_codon:yes gene_type:complete
MTKLKPIILLVLICFSGSLFSQNIANGTYISHKGGIIPKYAILTVNNDSATLEIFTKWQGAWLPAIGSWDNSYRPQILRHTGEFRLVNKNTIIEKRKNNKVIAIVKNIFTGKGKFKFKIVDKVPDKYLEIKQKAIEFTARK